MADMIRVEQPKIETEIKIGNTTYIVGGTLPPRASPFQKRSGKYLTRKQKQSMSKYAEICISL